MEHQKALVPRSSPPPPSDDHHFSANPEESLFSSLVYDMSQQVQSAMENMLNLTRLVAFLFISLTYQLNREVDQRTSEITEEIGKCKEFGAVRQKVLEEERVRIEKAAYAVLELLHAREAH